MVFTINQRGSPQHHVYYEHWFNSFFVTLFVSISALSKRTDVVVFSGHETNGLIWPEKIILVLIYRVIRVAQIKLNIVDGSIQVFYIWHRTCWPKVNAQSFVTLFRSYCLPSCSYAKIVKLSFNKSLILEKITATQPK